MELEDRKIKLHDVLYFSNHNGDWVKLPARPYEKDGQKKFFPLVSLLDEDAQAVLKQISNEIKAILMKEQVEAVEKNVNVQF